MDQEFKCDCCGRIKSVLHSATCGHVFCNRCRSTALDYNLVRYLFCKRCQVKCKGVVIYLSKELVERARSNRDQRLQTVQEVDSDEGRLTPTSEESSETASCSEDIPTFTSSEFTHILTKRLSSYLTPQKGSEYKLFPLQTEEKVDSVEGRITPASEETSRCSDDSTTSASAEFTDFLTKRFTS